MHRQRPAAGILLPPPLDNEMDPLVIWLYISERFIILEDAFAFYGDALCHDRPIYLRLRLNTNTRFG